MSRVAIVAYGALSALGEGDDAASAGVVGEAARLGIAHDAELADAGLARPFVARVRIDERDEDRATAILRRALASCANELDRVRPRWRDERVGLVLGTSSGGMRSAERLFDGVTTSEATYFAPMQNAANALGVAGGLAPATLVLAACASSTIAIGLATRWLEVGDCDIVIAGGFDAVSVFVAAGFEALRATTATPPPRPFRVGRDGMALGEGAAVLALARADGTDVARAYVTGFGASADAVHLTAPDRTGAGVVRAASRAMREAGRNARGIDLVSPHATATPFNDPAESRALATLLGTHAANVPLQPFKAQIGHTLGAAGVLETLACVDAIARGVLPASAGTGELDPDAPARLLDVAEASPVRAALKLSSAFGGANAALVVARDPDGAIACASRDAFVGRAVHVDRDPDVAVLAARLGVAVDRVARADALTRLALEAVARLVDVHGSLAGAAIVVGQSLATIETNALFHAKIRDRGSRFAEPRRFPYTSPNAVAGECSLAFGLTGPSFAVGSGLHAGVEALAVAALLVRAGDAERAVVVAVDEIGDVARRLAPDATSGAVATLVTASADGAVARIASVELTIAAAATAERGPVGHLALLPLVADVCPASLAASSPPAARARVGLTPVDRA